MADLVNLNMQFDCVVVGAGVLGSSTAYQLSKGGSNVLLLDQFSLPHSRGSSCGAVRILRYPYVDVRQQHAMPEQYQMWHQLERELDTVFTHGVSMLVLAPSRNDVFTNKLDITHQSGIACRELTDSDLKECFPMLHFPGGASFKQDEILVIDAHKAIRCLQQQFVRNGGTLRDGEEVVKIEPGPIVTLCTNRGREYRAKGVVLAPGPWASKLLQPLGLHLPIKVWRVNVCYFQEKVKGSHCDIPVLLCHVGEGSLNHFCVFPSREYPGLVKVNYHILSDEVDPDSRDRPTGEAQFDVNEMKEFVKMHLPGLHSEPSLNETCMYTCTPKEELIVGTHPLHSNIAIGCSMSGKGFKMAPLLGKVLGEMALGKPPSFDTSLISINRFVASPPPKL